MYILPICDHPAFLELHTSALPLSILEANKNFSKLWLIHNFLPVVFDKRYDGVLTYKRPLFWLWRCFKLKISLHYPRKNVINTIKHYLKKDFYVFICVNEKYIPERSVYQRCDNNHELLIYGYDDNQNCFHTIAYNDKEKYERQNISFENINDAFVNNPEHLYKFFALQVPRKFDFKSYNNKLLKKNVAVYLQSARYEYGLLRSRTEDDLRKKCIVDIRSYRTIRDRAELFSFIPQFYNVSDETTNLIKENEKRGCILFMKVLKWNMAFTGEIDASNMNQNLADSILRELDNYVKVEMQIIKNLPV